MFKYIPLARAAMHQLYRSLGHTDWAVCQLGLPHNRSRDSWLPGAERKDASCYSRKRGQRLLANCNRHLADDVSKVLLIHKRIIGAQWSEEERYLLVGQQKFPIEVQMVPVGQQPSGQQVPGQAGA
jgi:hypothetical protein